MDVLMGTTYKGGVTTNQLMISASIYLTLFIPLLELCIHTEDMPEKCDYFLLFHPKASYVMPIK